MLGYRPQRSQGGAAALDPLVPANHFYRHLARTLDLTFVRDLVATCYASKGRPSIDPVIFFKLQLILFFEGIRSERQLMRTIADRVSLRWYLGYAFGEALPHHSSLSGAGALMIGTHAHVAAVPTALRGRHFVREHRMVTADRGTQSTPTRHHALRGSRSRSPPQTGRASPPV